MDVAIGAKNMDRVTTVTFCMDHIDFLFCDFTGGKVKDRLQRKKNTSCVLDCSC